MKCPNCAKENMVLRMTTTIDFDADEDGRVDGVVNDFENLELGEELREEYQQDAEYHCYACHSSFEAVPYCLNGMETYKVGSEI